ncbi:MAG: methyltransferase [Pseudomonadota bacterium]
MKPAHGMARLTRPLTHALFALGAATLLASTLAPSIAAAAGDPIEDAINSPLRSADDRKDDAKRKPAQFLAFAMVRPGMKALDVAAGGGGTASLLALAVGSGGEVWAQTGKASERLEKRLAASPQPNLHPAVRSFDDPVPSGVSGLDLVTINMSYHDIVNTPADRAAMNKHLFDALKPGGHLVIIDNAAKDGSGISATNTLHRIDEAVVIAEVSKAGFALDARADYLRVPSDPREQPFFKMDKPDDKFALRFVKK